MQPMTRGNLPPQTQTLSSFVFGQLYIQLTQPLDLPQSKYSLHFMHASQKAEVSPSNSLTVFDIRSSLWHFFKYLKDYPKLVINVQQNGLTTGTGNVHLPSVIYSHLTRSSINIMERTLKRLPIFQTSGHGQLGAITLTFWCQFDRQYTSLIRDIIGSELVSQELRVPISNIAIQSEHEINIDFPCTVDSNLGKNQKTMQAQMNNQIDKIIEEMQSKVYNSAKYQDQGVRDTYSDRQDKPASMPLKLQVTEYSLYNRSLNYNSNHMQTRHCQPLHSQFQNTYRKSSVFKNQQKILRIQVHQLGFSGGLYNQEELEQLGRSELRVTFPSGYSLSVPGIRKGQTTLYQTEQQMTVEQTESPSGPQLFRGDNQTLLFVISSSVNGKQLAYGLFQLERLFKFQSKGVFFVAMNNRNKISKSGSRVTVSASELRNLKPLNISSYNLRVGLELLSSLKNKIYQLLLNIRLVKFDFRKQVNPQFEIRYKTIGSLETITVRGQEQSPVQHTMVMPVLLQPIITNTNPNMFLQVWGVGSSERLIGIVEISLSRLQKLLNANTGTFNDDILNVNLDPLVIHSGNLPIKSIMKKQSEGNVNLGLYFGTSKQINSEMAKITKSVVLTAGDKPRKQVSVPFDQQLGVFIKQKKKEVKEVQIQVGTSQANQSGDNFEVIGSLASTLQMKNSLVQQRQQEDCQQQGQYDQEMQPFVVQNDLMNKYKSPAQEQTNQFIAQKQHPISNTQSLTIVDRILQTSKQSGVKPTSSCTLSQTYKTHIQSTLSKVLKVNPCFLGDVKAKLKSRVQFNFVEDTQLLKAIEDSVHIDFQTIGQLVKILPLSQDSGLVSITPLYDYFNCMEISGQVDLKLISEDLLADFIISTLVQKCHESGHRSCYIQEYEDVKEVFSQIGVSLTLRERDIFWKRYRHDLKIQTPQTWGKVFGMISRNLESTYQDKARLEEEEKLIQETLYAVHSPTIEKREYLVVTLKGMQSCLESIECLLSVQANKIQVHIDILGQLGVFCDDSTSTISLQSLRFRREQFQYQNGVAILYIDGESVSRTTFSLQSLVHGEVSGTYSFKDKNGSFCGLIRLHMTYVQ